MQSLLWKSTNLIHSSTVEMEWATGVSHWHPVSFQGQGLLLVGAILVRGRGVRWAKVQR